MSHEFEREVLIFLSLRIISGCIIQWDDLELLAVIGLYLKFGLLILTALFVVHNFCVSVVWTFKIGTVWFVNLQACHIT